MRDEIFQKLQTGLSELLSINTENIRLESSLVDDLGVDSLDFLQLPLRIKRDFNISIPIEKWFKEINKFVKEGVPEEIENQLIKLCAEIGLQLSEQEKMLIIDLLKNNGDQWQVINQIISVITVETIVNTIDFEISKTLVTAS